MFLTTLTLYSVCQGQYVETEQLLSNQLLLKALQHLNRVYIVIGLSAYFAALRLWFSFRAVVFW